MSRAGQTSHHIQCPDGHRADVTLRQQNALSAVSGEVVSVAGAAEVAAKVQ
jgi:hypothetical protein